MRVRSMAVCVGRTPSGWAVVSSRSRHTDEGPTVQQDDDDRLRLGVDPYGPRAGGNEVQLGGRRT